MRARLGDYIEEYSLRNKRQDEIPVYSVTNTQGFCRDYFSKDVASKNKSTYKIVPRGYFAYNPSRVNVGSIDWQREEDRVIVSPLYVVFSVSDAIDQQYLLYYLKSDIALHLIREKASGSVRDNLKFSILSEFPIILRDKEAQLRIVKTLDLLENLIRINKTKLGKLDELTKSRFVEMFGDLEKRDLSQSVQLKTLLRSPASNGFFSKRKDYVDNGNVGVLGVVNVVNRMYSGIDDLPRTNASNRDISRYSLAYGDMLFCRSSLVLEGIGKASVVPRDVKPGTLFECHVIRVPLDTRKCVPEFMQVQSTMPFFRKQMMAKAKTATMTTIDQKSILSARVFLPPIEQQEEYLAFIQQVDKSKFAVQQAIDQLETLKASLMQKYFG